MPVTTTQGQVSRHAGIYLQLAVFCIATPSKLRVKVHQLSLDLMDSCVRVGGG